MVLISLAELIPVASAAMGMGATLTSAALGAALLWVRTWSFRIFTCFPSRLATGQSSGRPISLRSADAARCAGRLAMANAYVAAPGLGVLVAVAIALHNLPEEFAMAVPAMLLRSKRCCSARRFCRRWPSRWVRSSDSSR